MSTCARIFRKSRNLFLIEWRTKWYHYVEERSFLSPLLWSLYFNRAGETKLQSRSLGIGRAFKDTDGFSRNRNDRRRARCTSNERSPVSDRSALIFNALEAMRARIRATWLAKVEEPWIGVIDSRRRVARNAQDGGYCREFNYVRRYNGERNHCEVSRLAILPRSVAARFAITLSRCSE